MPALLDASRFDVIPYTDLSPENTWTKIGKGSFGCVYKGLYLGLEVAIKEVLYSDEYDVAKYFQREIKIMQESRHPNVVQYLGLCVAPKPTEEIPQASTEGTDRQRILIISEYLTGGNVRQYIASTSMPFPWRLRLSFAVDVTRAVTYMHARKCMHRDLKPENLLLTENNRVKVCDFGFARIAARNDDEMKRISYCGTSGYMSPEIIMGLEFGLETDVYSLGIIFCEILSRQFADENTFRQDMPSFAIDPAEVHQRASLGCPTAFINLAIACCDPVPSRRPKMREVLDRLSDIERQALLEDEQKMRSPAEKSYHIGSMNFGGLKTRKQLSRPHMPGRIPSFEGQVKVPSSSSSSASDSEDEAVEDILKQLEEVPIDGQIKHTQPEPNSYSTLVIGRNSRFQHNSSLITVRASPQKGGDDSDQGFPSLPSSWLIGAKPEVVAALRKDTAAEELPLLCSSSSSSASEDTLATPAEMENLPTPTKTSLALSALSFTGAIINGGDDEVDEEEDVFFLAPSHFDPNLHRFSLAKPGWRLFTTKPSSVAITELKASRSVSATDLTKDNMKVKTDAAGVLSRCDFCDKRLGVLKTHMTCDDCGFVCHIKCADIAPRSCLTHSSAANAPASSEANKLKKSRLSKSVTGVTA